MPSINPSKRNTEKKPEDKGYPSLESHLEKILVVIKTAPNPSVGYRETVCTAGITEGGKWIRLYPLAFRYSGNSKKFSKYQWISLNIKGRTNEKDFRLDSYEPATETITLGKKLPSGSWKERKEIVLPTVSKSIEELREQYDAHKISLGIIKPLVMRKFKIESGETDWSNKHKQVLKQGRLFESPPKKLEKIPYKFSYLFNCDDERCKGHELEIFDWELAALYLNMKQKYGYSMDLVLEKIKNKWFDEMWRDDKDSYLIIGTIYPKPSFIVLGVFWPPKLK